MYRERERDAIDAHTCTRPQPLRAHLPVALGALVRAETSKNHLHMVNWAQSSIRYMLGHC